jgi:hypothetical protein
LVSWPNLRREAPRPPCIQPLGAIKTLIQGTQVHALTALNNGQLALIAPIQRTDPIAVGMLIALQLQPAGRAGAIGGEQRPRRRQADTESNAQRCAEDAADNRTTGERGQDRKTTQRTHSVQIRPDTVNIRTSLPTRWPQHMGYQRISEC